VRENLSYILRVKTQHPNASIFW